MKFSKYIDYTNLKPTATEADIRRLCEEALHYDFASVCVNPCDVALAASLLEGSDVAVCTVIGFPLGRNTTQIKVAEAEKALADGCTEFDMVLNVGWLKEKKYDAVRADISAVVNAVPQKIVKVILETGFLAPEEIAIATVLSCEAGARFVKTCTGFTGGVATEEAVRIMKSNVTPDVLVKASGGIRSYRDAAAMIAAGANRIGTSAGIAITEDYLKIQK